MTSSAGTPCIFSHVGREDLKWKKKRQNMRIFTEINYKAIENLENQEDGLLSLMKNANKIT